MRLTVAYPGRLGRGAQPAEAMNYVPVQIPWFEDTLASPRLTIRTPRPGDGAELFTAVSESLAALREFSTSFAWTLAEPSPEASEAYCLEAHANFVARLDLPMLLLLKESGTIVGSSGLHRIDWKVPRFEVGFWGRSGYTGRGLITEGVAAIVDFAFAVLGAHRVECFPDDLNLRSCRLCERIGFALEGVMRHERVDASGRLRNTRVYAKIDAGA